LDIINMKNLTYPQFEDLYQKVESTIELSSCLSHLDGDMVTDIANQLTSELLTTFGVELPAK